MTLSIIDKYFVAIIEWLTDNFEFFFDTIKSILLSFIEGFEFVLGLPPAWVLIILFSILAWKLAGKNLSIFTLLGLSLISYMDLWDETIQTLALVLTSTSIALLVGIPLGIWMSKNNTVDNLVRPVLDFMQTMPAFVYLIPAVIFFDLGKVPGSVATVIFAMPPVVRLTSLGIRQVPVDVIEAAKSFGSTSKQMLLKVQLPLATPTILAGVNQTIMLSLSMVVISAMIGARGLGEVVLSGVTQMEIGKGFEGGIAVVILAMILDRVTQALGNKK